MLTAIKGYYEHGQIILTEQPTVTEKAEVVVIFLNAQSVIVPKKSMQGGLEGDMKIPDDSDDPLDY